ncbi:hypothetical protein [Novosphingobium sp.]|uniref:hypothetical protein n=1 Tax=Novosphingobium sp. TaxID=1874826 RepID=UPI003B527449
MTIITIEYVWLVRVGGWKNTDAVLRLSPGIMMLVALRAALAGQEWYWIALPLLVSFPLHLADIARHR